jgi:hypothetical protein
VHVLAQPGPEKHHNDRQDQQHRKQEHLHGEQNAALDRLAPINSPRLSELLTASGSSIGSSMASRSIQSTPVPALAIPNSV